MNSNPDLRITTATYDKVFEGKYAKIEDKTGLEGDAHRDETCRLFVLPNKFFPSGYGFALPMDSPYTELFSSL